MYMIENKPVAQGDILIKKVAELPKDVIKIEPENGEYIVAHSENGGHHAVKATPHVRYYQSANDNNVAYLVVDNTLRENTPELKHMRSFHTHGSYGFSDGVYQIRRQIEGSGLRGFVRVAD